MQLRAVVVPELASVAAVGFAAAAAAQLALWVLLACRGKAHAVGRRFLVALGVECGFNALAALGLLAGSGLSPSPIADSARAIAWVVFLAGVLGQAAPSAALAPTGPRIFGRVPALPAAVILASVLAAAFELAGANGSTAVILRLTAALLTMLMLERIGRLSAGAGAGRIGYLLAALGMGVVIDIIACSVALATGTVWSSLNAAAGYVGVAQVPLLALAAARNPQWKLDIGISREVVFGSATLVASGLYLFVLGVCGLYVRTYGGSVGEVASVLLAIVGLIGLAALVGSEALRRRLRVWLTKHFFSHRYDYRAEWLKVTGLLSAPSQATGARDIHPRCVGAIAGVAGGSAGSLWLKDPDRATLHCAYGAQGSTDAGVISAEAAWVARMAAERWIVEVGDAAASSDASRSPARADLPAALSGARYLVPLFAEGGFMGFVAIDAAPGLAPLDWETRDLLHAVGAQIASHIAMQRTVEALVQARQFDSFNRMSAFVVHDLKNLVSQLALLSRNAERHWDKAEFRDEALVTVRNVLERMQGLLMQLRSGSNPVKSTRPVLVGTLLEAVVRSKAHLPVRVVLDLAPGARSAMVKADPDRLERVVGHVVQNAAEASPSGGCVRIAGYVDGAQVRLAVIDEGVGMSPEFMRDRLFKPFTTTKAHGMGIGMFESREYIREIGGDVAVVSRPGLGTTVTLSMPARVLHDA